MAVDTSELHRLVERRARGAELVYTKGRRELVELLAGLSGPATMPELVEQRPKLTLSSMYRNMSDLADVGIVQKVIGTDEHTRYELAEDLIGHHHHTICTECGSIGDFVLAASTERSLTADLKKVLSESGFRPTGHRLDAVGICADCAS